MQESFARCVICNSPHRDEMEKLVRNRYSKPTVAHLYADLHSMAEDSFYRSLRLHFNKKHPPALEKLNIAPNIIKKAKENYQAANPQIPVKITDDEEKLPMTKELYAQRLLELGFDKSLMNPNSIKHKDVIAAQKLLIEEKKLKVTEDAMKVSMMKFMAGLALPEDVVEGEVEEDGSSIPQVTAGN